MATHPASQRTKWLLTRDEEEGRDRERELFVGGEDGGFQSRCAALSVGGGVDI